MHKRLVEHQRWLRIRLSVAAYAYEFDNAEIMSDTDFDLMSLEVNPTITTGNPKLDKFFVKHFDPSTGGWIWKHPERAQIKALYEKHWKSK